MTFFRGARRLLVQNEWGGKGLYATFRLLKSRTWYFEGARQIQISAELVRFFCSAIATSQIHELGERI